MMRRFAVLILLVLSAAALSVVPGAAQAPPPPHEHVLMTPAGPVDVGPPRCGNEQLQGAFLKFHFNVHVGSPPTMITPRFC
jgi:hypothetical protein